MKILPKTQFGRLTVIRFDYIKNGYSYFLCRCTCGNTKSIAGRNLIAKNRSTKSCGCLHIEQAKQISALNRVTNITHGLSKSPEYYIWRSMKARCCNKKHWQYQRYGGRGINVCAPWLESIENFYKDMGPRPSPLHTLERKNNDSGYSKENCIWASYQQQARNRSNSKTISFNGNVRTIAEWSELTGIQYNTIRYRFRANWPVENIFRH